MHPHHLVAGAIAPHEVVFVVGTPLSPGVEIVELAQHLLMRFDIRNEVYEAPALELHRGEPRDLGGEFVGHLDDSVAVLRNHQDLSGVQDPLHEVALVGELLVLRGKCLVGLLELVRERQRRVVQEVDLVTERCGLSLYRQPFAEPRGVPLARAAAAFG